MTNQQKEAILNIKSLMAHHEKRRRKIPALIVGMLLYGDALDEMDSKDLATELGLLYSFYIELNKIRQTKIILDQMDYKIVSK